MSARTGEGRKPVPGAASAGDAAAPAPSAAGRVAEGGDEGQVPMRQAATFRVGGEWFGIDVLRVREILTPLRSTQVPQAPGAVLGLINVRGVIMTQLSLAQRLGLSDEPPKEDHHHIVVETGEAPVSVVVDEIGDVIDVGTREMTGRPPTIQAAVRDMVLGVLRLDGRLVTLLDVERLVAP